jgi:nickel/cobalt transporter (NicO) family protein
MNEQIVVLTGTAAALAFTHTLFGPDHYLPFIVMSKARKWSTWKTIWVTLLSGLGHVGSSVVLGIIGIAFGLGISKIEIFEGFRGNLAAWAFILFGGIYFLYGIWRVYKKKQHSHPHVHEDGTLHIHDHKHAEGHDHVHKKNITPWVLFTIFVLGPCEPLIPVLMFPAAKENIGGLIMVTVVFSVITLATMLGIVLLASYGIKILPFGKLEKYTHAIAGATIMLSGLAIVFLGL